MDTTAATRTGVVLKLTNNRRRVIFVGYKIGSDIDLYGCSGTSIRHQTGLTRAELLASARDVKAFRRSAAASGELAAEFTLYVEKHGLAAQPR